MPQASTSKRILFVDDEASIRMTLPPILERAGFEVRIAESVPDAIFEINSYKFDALITDLNIGEEGDGFLVASSMRHIQPNCVTFILTGFPAFETALQAIHTQVDDYLVKPVEVQSLIDTLKGKIEDRSTLASAVKRLPALVKENSTQIIEEVLAARKSESANPAAGGEATAYLNTLLSALVEQMEQEGSEVDGDALHSAAEFGQIRKQSGAPISVIVNEFRAIGEAVFQLIQNNFAVIEPVTLVSDLRRFNAGLSLLMGQALEAFAQGRTPRGVHS
jgi:ActR/RegA family two-component response regulator